MLSTSKGRRRDAGKHDFSDTISIQYDEVNNKMIPCKQSIECKW